MSELLDFEALLSAYKALSLLLVFEFTDHTSNCELRIYSVEVKFDMDEGEWHLFDSNEKNINSLHRVSAQLKFINTFTLSKSLSG